MTGWFGETEWDRFCNGVSVTGRSQDYIKESLVLPRI